MTSDLDHFRQVARAVCTPKELDALAVLANDNYRGQAAKAASLGITTRAYRYRITSAVTKIINAYTNQQENAA